MLVVSRPKIVDEFRISEDTRYPNSQIEPGRTDDLPQRLREYLNNKKDRHAALDVERSSPGELSREGS